MPVEVTARNTQPSKRASRPATAAANRSRSPSTSIKAMPSSVPAAADID